MSVRSTKLRNRSGWTANTVRPEDRQPAMGPIRRTGGLEQNRRPDPMDLLLKRGRRSKKHRKGGRKKHRKM